MSASESRTAILRLTGILTGAVVVTTECIGFFFVENLTTGSFAVTVKNDQAATAVTIPQGSRQTVISDATNGCRIISSGFETGVKAAFYMSTAPIGWTRDATAALNNALLRLVTTGGAATGGTNNFTTVNSGLTLTRANLPNQTLSVTGIVTTSLSNGDTVVRGNGGGTDPGGGGIRGTTTSTIAASSVFSSGVTESINGGTTQTAVDLNIKYADFLVAAKD